MSAFRFREITVEGMSPDWRPLDLAAGRWVVAQGGSDALALCAARCSYAEGQGHTAVQLSSDEALAIAGESMVGNGAETSAFVLDAAGWFQFWRNHAAERAVAAVIAARCDVADTRPVAMADEVEALFEGVHPESSERQREAVRIAPAYRLVLLTGGPGTGKTTTVIRMLTMMLRCAHRDLSIRVAAPTGKAAQRLVQAMNRGIRELRQITDRRWDRALAAMPRPEALTVHRLLGYDPRSNRYTRTADHPIAADVVVVDEASMMDLEQARHLLAALRPDSTLILVGDPDQLTSVASGAVLLDLVDALETAPQHVALRHVFRAENHLVAVNEAVRRGDVLAFESAMAGAPDVLDYRHITARRSLDESLRGWADQLCDVLRNAAVSARHDPASARSVLVQVTAMQLLCALRETPFGALAVDRRIETLVRKGLGEDDDAQWFAGRMVMIVQNDYSNALFNGDIGIALPGTDGQLLVWFEAIGDDGEVTTRCFVPNMLPEHEGAYAITVHKSQGSEYSHVALLLPPDADNRVLSRQLVYTGVSRAKRALSIWGAREVIAAALGRSVQRDGGLAAKLQLALANSSAPPLLDAQSV